MFKSAIFGLVARVLPSILGHAIAAQETIAGTPGATKADRAVVIGREALNELNDLAGNDLANHPEFISAVRGVNDAIVTAANVAAKLAANK